MSELPEGKAIPDPPEQPTGRRSWGLSAETHEDDQSTRPLRLAARSAGMLQDDGGESDTDEGTKDEDAKEQDAKEQPVTNAAHQPDPTDEAAESTEAAEAVSEDRAQPEATPKPVDAGDEAGSDANERPSEAGSGESRDEPKAAASVGDDSGKADEAKDEATPESDEDGADEGGADESAPKRDDSLFRRPTTVKVEAQDQSRVPAPTSTRPTAAVHVTPPPPAAATSRPDAPERRYSANDLLEQLTPEAPAKSSRGWRSVFGLKPSQRESDEMRDLESVKTVFRRPVTIMVANPKGGSGKTPVSVLLAAAFGQTRGGGVVAWDNNELRGTLPDRTDSPHRRNIHDLLESLDQLRWSTSQFTDLAYFLNRQDSGNFYTLGSAQEAGHVVSGQNFRQVHELFGRYFQVIIVDTGNNEAAPNWTAAAAEADCLVVPTKWRKDSLIPAARMLESLQDTNPGLLDRTVIAATNGPSDSQKSVRANAAGWFGSSHPIVDIPMDPHIAEGGQIDYALLKDATRRASLRLAAEVATRLIEAGQAASATP